MDNQAKQAMRSPRIIQTPVMNPKRGVLNRIRKLAEARGFDKGAVREHRLRLYYKLTANSPQVEFYPNTGTGASQHSAEIRLEKSDVFYLTHIGLGIHKVLISSGQEKPGNTKLIHYPDVNYFTETNEARDLNMLYNMRINFKTDVDIRFENYDTAQLLTTTLPQFNGTASTGTTWNHNGSELKEVAANYAWWGSKNNKVMLQSIPGDYSAWVGAATHQNYAVLLMDGFIWVNGAESLTKSDLVKLV